jgi:hypothetical protein
MTILSGTGASRTLILQTTTSGGTATNAISIGATQVATFSGGVASSGSTTGTVVISGSGGLGVGGHIYGADIVQGARVFATTRLDSPQLALASSPGFGAGIILRRVSDGVCYFTGIDAAAMSRIGFGGTTSSFVAQQFSGTTMTIGTADGGTSSGSLTVCGDFSQSTAGKLFTIKSGTGQRAGNATLVGGTVTVTNTTVTANTLVHLNRKTPGGTVGDLSYTLNAGASFVINSASALDTSVVTYFLIELN